MSKEPLHHYIPKMLLRNFQSLTHSKNGFIYTNDHITRKSMRRSIKITAAIRSLNNWRFSNNTAEISIEDRFGKYESEASPVLREVISKCEFPSTRSKMKKVIRFYNQLDDRSLPNRRRIYDIITEGALSSSPSNGIRIDAQSLQGDITCVTIVDDLTYPEALKWEWVLLYSHEPIFILTDHSTHHKFLLESYDPYDQHWMIFFPLTPHLCFASFSSILGRSLICRDLPRLSNVANTYRISDEMRHFIIRRQRSMMCRYTFSPEPIFTVIDSPDYEENVYDHPVGYKIGTPPSSASKARKIRQKRFRMANGNTFVPFPSDNSIAEAPYSR